MKGPNRNERCSGPGPGLGALQQLAKVVEGADDGEFAHGLAVAGEHHGGRTRDARGQRHGDAERADFRAFLLGRTRHTGECETYR